VRLLIVVALVAFSARAHAEEPARDAMTTYFKGEKRGGYTLIAMGLTEMLAGTLMVVGSAGDNGNEYVRGASYPLLTVGLLHAVAGLFVNTSSNKRIRVFGDDITRDAKGWTEREAKRMKGVSTQFFVLKIVETAVATGALATAAIVRDDNPTLTGACIGIAGMMAATFVFDVVAAKRAYRYRRSLAGLQF
jgi:hypothetical protein